MVLFILIRKKGQKRFIGAIPAKPGVSAGQLRRSVQTGLRKGLEARIVTASQLKRVIKSTRIRSGRRVKSVRRRKKKR